MEKTYQQIHQVLLDANRVLLVSHKNPDGDTSGSCLALSHYLDIVKKPHTCFCVDELSPPYRFLPGADRYSQDPKVFSDGAHDVIVVLDSSNLEYAGVHEHLERATGKPTIVNIDHHATNAAYGHHNLVESHRASTTEIIFNFFDALRLPMNPRIATCLLTGVLTDTGTFSNPATNATALSAAAQLMLHGARIPDILLNVMSGKSVPQLALWGRALERLKEDPDTGFVSTVIWQRDIDENEVDAEAANGVANFIGGISNGKAVIVLREAAGDIVKGSLRTTSDLIDVAEIAKLYGGGGHRKAAGFTVAGSIRETPNGWIVDPARGEPLTKPPHEPTTSKQRSPHPDRR